MCGIIGLWNKDKGPARDVLDAMSGLVSHRGPDGAGVFFRPPIALGHRRLSIIDIEGGTQPMTVEDGRYAMVFNGEIYNYLELKKELESTGVSFKTRSDSEVLLQAYVRWGEACLDRLIGMFAFAIWDSSRQELFIARDRAGKKPLNYFWDGRTFAFASELKAFTCLEQFEPKLDGGAVELFLALGYVPSPWSIFSSVKKLGPGHSLVFKDGEITIKRYWYPERACHNASADRTGEFRGLFSDAVRLRLRSDVPIGIFLSGGIDSTAVALESVVQGVRLSALSVCFDNDATDVAYSKKAAQFLGLSLDVLEVAGDFSRDLERIFWHYDEPFGDTSSIPSYYIARAASGRFKVVLNGDGGDELFGGYRRYENMSRRYWMKRLASAIGLKDGGKGLMDTLLQSAAVFRKKDREALIRDKGGDEFVSLARRHPYISAFSGNNTLKAAIWLDRSMYLPDDLLYKMDIALSAFGIEGRSPFLDHRLLEWALCLPSDELVIGKEKKVFLKKALRSRLPDEILDRPKHGFGSPVSAWLRGPLKDVLKSYLPCPLFEQGPQKVLLQRLEKGGGSETSYMVWNLFAFAVWARRFGAHW